MGPINAILISCNCDKCDFDCDEVKYTKMLLNNGLLLWCLMENIYFWPHFFDLLIELRKCMRGTVLLELRSCNKAGPHYLIMDAQWQREMTSVVSANEHQCISYSCTVRSIESTCIDCAPAYNIATSQGRTPKYFIMLVCLSGLWQHRPRYLCLTLRVAKTSTRFLTPSRL